MKRAIYPGTFDPITLGHLDIIKRALHIFDEIYVAVAESKEKKPLFSLDKRVKMVEMASKEFKDRVKVVSFDTLLVELSDKLNINVIIRGLRAVSDFEYELQMGYANASLKEIDTIYLMPTLQYAFISSSVVRTILKYGGKVEHLVPKEILSLLK